MTSKCMFCGRRTLKGKTLCSRYDCRKNAEGKETKAQKARRIIDGKN